MIDYEEEWLLPLLFKLDGSVYGRSIVFAGPAAIISLALVLVEQRYPELYEDNLFARVTASQIWGAATTVLILLLGFRSKEAYNRFWEGTGLLHQMKGEWFDTVSNCVSFTLGSVGEHGPGVLAFRHTIVRLMSLCHGSALEEISGMETTLETIDTLGLSTATLRHLKDCVESHGFNKVEVLLHMLQTCITKAHNDGILDVPPPILSRVYQTISRGYVNLLNTKKITDTKFPFPFVQVIVFLLLVHLVLTPVVISHNLPSMIFAPLVSFIFLFGAFAINFISMQLEDPFGEDSNDLPLAEFQAEMNNCLMMLLHPGTDVVAGIDEKRCTMDFEVLKESTNISTRHSSTMSDHSEETAQTGQLRRMRSTKSCYHFNVEVDILGDEPLSPLSCRIGSNGLQLTESVTPSTARPSTCSFANSAISMLAGEVLATQRSDHSPRLPRGDHSPGLHRGDHFHRGDQTSPVLPRGPPFPLPQHGDHSPQPQCGDRSPVRPPSPRPAGPPFTVRAELAGALEALDGGVMISLGGDTDGGRVSSKEAHLSAAGARSPDARAAAQLAIVRQMEEVSATLRNWTAGIDEQVRAVTERLALCAETSEALLNGSPADLNLKERLERSTSPIPRILQLDSDI